MKTPHKHAELIKAWADGAKVQYRANGIEWFDSDRPHWHDETEYRIKPEPKPDFCALYKVSKESPDWCNPEFERMPVVNGANLVLTFDGETGALKAAEVLK